MQASDRELLERFAAGRDEAAFRVLVERHLAMVHGVARRVTANEDLARDVAQNAFVRLAQRAALIPEKVTLTAWLHRVTQHLAIDLVRSEERRKKRELATHDLAAMDNTPEPNWSAMAPVVDALVNRLPAADREVLLLRYYRNEPHAAIARQLGLNEEAAKKRAARALEKLRGLLAKQGIATSAVALATLLPAQAAPPVPGTLVLSVTAAAKNTVPLAPQILNLHLAMSTAQKTAIAVAAVIFMSSVGYAFRSSSEETAHLSKGNATDPAAGSSGIAGKERIRPAKNAGLSAEERLERLRQIVAIRSNIERSRQMLAFVDELGVNQFAETADQLEQLQVKPYATDFQMLLGTWTRLNPRAAMAWAGEPPRENTNHQYQVLKVWGESDPDAALDWVMHESPTFKQRVQEWQNDLIGPLSGMAARDSSAAIKALYAVIPDEATRLKILDGVRDQMQGQPDVVARLAGAMERGPLRSRFIVASEVRLILDGVGGKALDYYLAEEDTRKLANFESFFAYWQMQDLRGTHEALHRLEDVPEGELRNQAVAGICRDLVGSDRKQGFDLLRRYPGAISDELMAFVARDIPVQEAEEFIFKIKDSTLRDEVLSSRLRDWIMWDEAAARKWMKGRELPATVIEALKPPAPEAP